MGWGGGGGGGGGGAGCTTRHGSSRQAAVSACDPNIFTMQRDIPLPQYV